MSVSQNPEAATILDEIAKLCLNENYSDVSFVVGGEKLPAHRNILGQRCPVLNAIFLKGEPIDELVKLKEAPVDALKMFLKFIYTGIVELDAVSVNIVCETFKLARVFEMKKLEEICIDHLKNICVTDNVADLVNATFEKSSALTKFYINYIAMHYEKFVEHKTFKKLSVEVFECLFEAGTLQVSNKIIVNSFVKWMKANPSKSAQFPEPLKHIRLNAKYAQGCVKHLKNGCNVDNVTGLVNATFEKSHELFKFCLEYIDTHYAELAKHETFKKLSVEVIKRFFEDFEPEAPHDIISKSVVDWMQANPSESAQFPELLKHVRVNAIALNNMITAVRSLKLIADKDLLDIVYGCDDWEDDDSDDDSSTFSEESVEYPEGNVLTPQSDAKVVGGGNYFFFTSPSKGATLKQMDKNIEIYLARSYMMNYLEMELPGGDQSYWIDVSEDYGNWTRIIDNSNVTCRSVQRLYFEERPVHYIRICGTAPANGMFEISRLEAYYTEDPLDIDPETNIVTPSNNVVPPEKDTIIRQEANQNAQGGVVDNAKNDQISTYPEIGISCSIM